MPNESNETATPVMDAEPQVSRESVPGLPAQRRSRPTRKTRDIETLMTAAPKGMTPTEKDNLIKHLQGEVQLRTHQAEAFAKSAEEAFDARRTIVEQYEQVIRKYRSTFNSINVLTDAIKKSMEVPTNGN